MVKLRFPQNLRFFLFFIVYLAAPSPVWHITYTAGCVTAAWCYCSAAGAAQSRPVLQSGDLPPTSTSLQGSRRNYCLHTFMFFEDTIMYY